MAKNKVAPDFIPDDEAPEFISDADAPDFISDEDVPEENGGGGFFSGLGDLLEGYESYTGAPTRKSLVSLRHGENPFAAYAKQMGQPSQTAPTPTKVASEFGASEEALPPRTGGGLAGMLPFLFPEKVGMGMRDMPEHPRSGGISPADIASVPIALTASPDMLIAPAFRGAKGAIRGLRGLDEVGAIGSKIPKVKPPAPPPQEGLQAVDKLNIEQIKEAAKELGLPTFEGQLSADRFTQMLEGSLHKSPSPIGRVRQEKLRGALEKIRGGISESIPSLPADVSKFDVGSDVQKTLLKNIGEEKAPIGNLYDKIRESTQNIPVPLKSTAATSKSIGKTGKFSGPENAMLKEISQDVLKIDNVDDVKKLITKVNGRFPPGAATPNELNAVKKITRRLKALEEGTVIRQAKTMVKETGDPQVKDLVETLISDRRGANASWKEFMGNLSELSKGLGKGKIQRADQAEDFLKNIKVEKLVDRLSQKDNAGFLKFFSKKYPDQAQKIFAFQKDKILKLPNMIKDDKINIPKALGEIDKLSKEARELMFSPEQLRKFDLYKTYYQSLPPNFNPSDTNTAKEFLEIFKNPVSYLTRTGVDAGMLGLLKRKSVYSPEAFEKARKAGMAGAKATGKATSKTARIKALTMPRTEE